MVVIMNFGMMGIIMAKVPNMSLYKTMIIVFVRIMIIINTMLIMGSATKVTIMPLSNTMFPAPVQSIIFHISRHLFEAARPRPSRRARGDKQGKVG